MFIIKQFTQKLTYQQFKTQAIKRFYSPPIFKDQTNKKSLNVTDSASKQLTLLKQKFPEKRMRVAVEAGGCHGFQYKFSFETEAEETDCFFTNNNCATTNNTPADNDIQIICDNVSWSMIKDAKLDYQNELIGSAFRIIDNPVADSGCGCGVSFDLKSNK